MLFLSLCFVSCLISLITVAVIKQRFSQQLLDIPNDRSSHTQPTPRGGGLGFIVAFTITGTLGSQLRLINPNLLGLLLVLTPLAIIGIIDDRYNVPAKIRYLVQLVASAGAIACFGCFPQPWLAQFGIVGNITAIVCTLIGITALINFYNFMDGLDGLVAGVSVVQLSFLAFYLNQPIWWLEVAALIGFLWWNWTPAKIFMGDVGSTVLGATIAIALLHTNNNPIQAWSALGITLPLISDAIYTLIRRLIRAENIFQAHRSHIYQRLQQSGLSHSQVAITYIGLTILSGISIRLGGLDGAIISFVGVTLALIIAEVYLRQKSHLLENA